jgi:hypothetical protein
MWLRGWNGGSTRRSFKLLGIDKTKAKQANAKYKNWCFHHLLF